MRRSEGFAEGRRWCWKPGSNNRTPGWVRRLAAGLVLSAGFAACASAPEVRGKGVAVETISQRPAPYGLYTIIRPAGSDPCPAEYDGFALRFEAAKGAYDNENYEESARGFISAATLLPIAAGPHASTLAADRSSAYRNAALAWLMAGVPGEARRVLEPIAARDVECAAVIAEVLKSLPGR